MISNSHGYTCNQEAANSRNINMNENYVNKKANKNRNVNRNKNMNRNVTWKLRMLGGVQDPYVSVTMIGELDSLDWLR